ncbi:hypothetical protein TRIUR3_16879 [Triticum urartu]|uniref:Uncharacterized protein n=1 Tax=Triticum urartu TaxID=4572 RepID=M8A4Y6_TRIUA|nr:hypothetical protein TRIUR3_16879 [Triticum urartu]
MSPRKDAGPSPAAAPPTPPALTALPFHASVSRPLEDVVADFLARVPPERRLRFGSAIKFLLEASR